VLAAVFLSERFAAVGISVKDLYGILNSAAELVYVSYFSDGNGPTWRQQGTCLRELIVSTSLDVYLVSCLLDLDRRCGRRAACR